MKNKSAGYEILRFYVRFAFRLTHKKITTKGKQLIPKGKPIIFAPNHQNALMDPLALVCTNPHQSVWLARADIFKSKAFRPILKFLKLLPVYRIRDGKENLTNNEEIFAQVIQLLENKQTVALFPEAAHSGRRQMLDHKKAIPRIALEAEAKNDFQLDLQIVPVGIFYSHYWNFNRSLIVQYGKPIPVDGFKTGYAENPQKTMLDLRDEIHNRLLPLTLQLNSKTQYPEYEQLCLLAAEAYSRVHFFDKNADLQIFEATREFVSKVEELENHNPGCFEKLVDGTNNYFEALVKAHLTNDQVKLAEKATWDYIPAKICVVLCTLPLFAFGFIFNAIPVIIPRAIVRQKVKDTTFLSTFNFVIGLFVFPSFYLAATFLIFILSRSMLYSLTTLIMMPLVGKIAYQLLIFYQNILLEVGFLSKNKRQSQINSILEAINS
jgi:1-acyl-sn-glycerol-3-phosphate acyltransferase